jgi:hypothetical protein
MLYVLAIIAIVRVADTIGLSEISVILLQLLLQVLLGASAYDLKRHRLSRRGYVCTGVIIADSEIAAEQRFYEQSTP